MLTSAFSYTTFWLPILISLFLTLFSLSSFDYLLIALVSDSTGAYFGTGIFGTSGYGQGDLPITRESVEGSGFAVALKITDTSTNAPFAIKGFQLEFTPGGRR